MALRLSLPHMPRPVPASDCNETGFAGLASAAGTTAATARPCLVMIVVRPATAAARIAGNCCRAASAPLEICREDGFMNLLYGLYEMLSRPRANKKAAR